MARTATAADNAPPRFAEEGVILSTVAEAAIVSEMQLTQLFPHQADPFYRGP
jgi:hypothetical protein